MCIRDSVSADGYAQAKDVLKIVVGLAACFEGAGLLLLLLAFVPVSYTHLDVYKRQEQIRQAVLSLETKWTEKEIGFQVELEEVKYTANEGLFMQDVYKRQVLAS